MADSPIAPPFQMVGARVALVGGPGVEAIELQVKAIEDSLERVPDLAFDLSKTLIETVCKTLLADLGQPANPAWECQQLFRETVNRLSFLPPNCPEPAKARDAIEKTMRGLLQCVQGVCELRNRFGIASHGRDALSVRLGVRLATLVARAADTIVSFLYVVHRDALNRTPAERVYYEDHREFNDAFDDDNGPVVIGDLKFLPSLVLFHMDREAYKAAVLEHVAQGKDSPDSKDESEGTVS